MEHNGEIDRNKLSLALRSAMQETEDILAGRVQARRYASARELFDALDAEEEEDGCKSARAGAFGYLGILLSRGPRGAAPVAACLGLARFPLAAPAAGFRAVFAHS